MQQNVINFIVEPDDIDYVFSSFKHKNPFSLKSEYKEYRKYLGIKISDEEFAVLLASELQAAYKNVKQGDYIYHNNLKFRIAILKFRKDDAKSKRGKSAGWRVIALVDEINEYFYLLSIYSHGQGKLNLSDIEKTKVRELCDEYAHRIK